MQNNLFQTQTPKDVLVGKQCQIHPAHKTYRPCTKTDSYELEGAEIVQQWVKWGRPISGIWS